MDIIKANLTMKARKRAHGMTKAFGGNFRNACYAMGYPVTVANLEAIAETLPSAPKPIQGIAYSRGNEWDPENRIFISTKINTSRRDWLSAHLLGHFFARLELNSKSEFIIVEGVTSLSQLTGDDPKEFYANVFAAELINLNGYSF